MRRRSGWGQLPHSVGRKHVLILVGVLVLLVVAAACGGGQGTPTPGSRESSLGLQPTPSPTAVIPNEYPRPVDTSIHSVPLESVVFDTFDGGFLRLSDADSRTIEQLRDFIRPIYQPRYDGPEGGDWLRRTDLIIGYVGEEAAYAYPVNMLNFHEIVNDEIDGVPVLITYCPLCASGVVFDRRVDGEALTFGNTSALYQNDLVMYDHQTGSYWFQVGGEAIVGTLTGKRLVPLPSVTMPWQQWRELHPETRVLSLEQGLTGSYSYEYDPFQGYNVSVDALNFPFPVSKEKLDTRLRPSALVLSVRVNGQEKAYPIQNMGNAAVNDTVGGEPVVVFSRDEGATSSAFSRTVDGRLLTFVLRDNQIRDQETNSLWDLAGRAVEGSLKGQQLKPLPTRRAFWFSLSLALPDIPLYQQEP